MKRVLSLSAFLVSLVACEATAIPMPETPTWAKGDGGAVQPISSKLTLDARAFLYVRINYDVNWDGLLGGATNSAPDQRAVWPASQLVCPRLWVWVSHDPSGSATWAFEQGYSMNATRTAIATSSYPTMFELRWQYYQFCEYTFREGGGETWRQGIPVQSGDNWMGFGVQCPGTTTGPTALTNVIKFTVPAGSNNVYNMATIDGPARNKGLYQAVAKYGCGWSADSWWDSPQTLHIGWCTRTPPNTSCDPGSDVDIQRSW